MAWPLRHGVCTVKIVCLVDLPRARSPCWKMSERLLTRPRSGLNVSFQLLRNLRASERASENARTLARRSIKRRDDNIARYDRNLADLPRARDKVPQRALIPVTGNSARVHNAAPNPRRSIPLVPRRNLAAHSPRGHSAACTRARLRACTPNAGCLSYRLATTELGSQRAGKWLGSLSFSLSRILSFSFSQLPREMHFVEGAQPARDTPNTRDPVSRDAGSPIAEY